MKKHIFKKLDLLDQVFLCRISAILIIVCVFASSAFSLGWFSSGKTAVASGMSISVAGSDFELAGYTAYKYDEAGIIVSGQDISMLKYDSIFSDRNDKCPVIIRIDFSKMKENQPITLKFKCSDTTANIDYVSDIICFRCTTLNLSGTIQEIYTAARSELEKATDPYTKYSFRTVSNGTASKSSEFETDPIQLGENESVYILMDYYAEIIDSVEVEFGGEASGEIAYAGDLSSIVISSETE